MKYFVAENRQAYQPISIEKALLHLSVLSDPLEASLYCVVGLFLTDNQPGHLSVTAQGGDPYTQVSLLYSLKLVAYTR